jgi:hypothetical protein
MPVARINDFRGAHQAAASRIPPAKSRYYDKA